MSAAREASRIGLVLVAAGLLLLFLWGGDRSATTIDGRLSGGAGDPATSTVEPVQTDTPQPTVASPTAVGSAQAAGPTSNQPSYNQPSYNQPNLSLPDDSEPVEPNPRALDRGPLGQVEPSVATIVESIDLAVDEPSGIARAANGGFWIVSDGAPELFVIDDDGTVGDQRAVDGVGDAGDWEGVAELSNGQLLVVSETNRDLLVIDPTVAAVVRRVSISELAANEDQADLLRAGGANQGLEGVTVDGQGNVWVVKEREPALLVQVDAELDRVISVSDPTAALAIALGRESNEIDLSGLTVDPETPDVLWITSHTAGAIVQWDTSTMQLGQVLLVATPKIEGLAFATNGRAFAVDDDSNQLLTLDW